MRAGASIRRLRLADFRNYGSLDLAVGARQVALIGENGAGKTNILEALSLLMAGRGLRRAEIAAMVRQGAAAFAVNADVEGALGHARLSTGSTPGESGRRYRIDRDPAPSAAAFADHLRIAWLTPDLDGLFRGAPGERRRFLDRLALVLDPGHGSRVNAYERALAGRNRLLEEDADARWLSALEREIAELAVAVAAGRRDLVAHLTRLAATIPEGAFPAAEIAIAGETEALLDTMPAAAAEDALRVALRDNRARDRAAGRALAGPQTSDLQVRHRAKQMPAGLCSTGEQKLLLIGLVLAHARLVGEATGQAPLLLLDEIAAHLDPRRRAALFGLLDEIGGQVWMTGTDAALFEALPAQATRLIVRDGAAEPFAA